jgi:3-oxoacyl-(acyl-carrier-protein) synthase
VSHRRVVITGMGIISPVGNTVAEAWANILAGKSGITRITRFDASAFPTQIGGEVKNFDVALYLSPKEARRMDTFIPYGLAAGIQAVVAKSFARIFYRNAFNIGLPIFESEAASEAIKEGDEIEIDADKGVIRNLTTNAEYKANPIPPFMQELIASGGLVEWTKRKLAI